MFHLLLLTPAVVLALLVLGYPLYLVIAASTEDIGMPSIPALNQRADYHANYTALGSDPQLHPGDQESLIYTVGSTAPAGLLGLRHRAAAEPEFRCGGVFRTLILLPWAVPTVVCQLPVPVDPERLLRGAELHLLKQLHLISALHPWLASPHWALAGSSSRRSGSRIPSSAC